MSDSTDTVVVEVIPCSFRGDFYSDEDVVNGSFRPLEKPSTHMDNSLDIIKKCLGVENEQYRYL